MMRRLSSGCIGPGRFMSSIGIDFRGAGHNSFDELDARQSSDFSLDRGNLTVVPGVHPLPLSPSDMDGLMFPLVSPFMPAARRPHPYFVDPPADFPHFKTTKPIVYGCGVMKDPIVVPVHGLDGEIRHTRELDPFLFGRYPTRNGLYYGIEYWVHRCNNFTIGNERERREVWRKAKKNWKNTGTGMGRVSDRKVAQEFWGGRRNPVKPWTQKMPLLKSSSWLQSTTMALTMKLLQGKLMVVEKLTLPEPTAAAFVDLCDVMEWNVDHSGAGVLFMDGGSRLAPSLEFDRNFLYGSFHNGKNKVVRPTVTCEQPIDWNRQRQHLWYRGPKGPKNPVPINHFNAYDCVDHHLLVISEGALNLLEEEVFAQKIARLPPHIVAQLDEAGCLGSSILGDVPPQLGSMQHEAAGRVEESEIAAYQGYYDNPYNPHADENEAGYEIDYVNSKIRRHNIKDSSIPGSWQLLE